MVRKYSYLVRFNLSQGNSSHVLSRAKYFTSEKNLLPGLDASSHLLNLVMNSSMCHDKEKYSSYLGRLSFFEKILSSNKRAFQRVDFFDGSS